MNTFRLRLGIFALMLVVSVSAILAGLQEKAEASAYGCSVFGTVRVSGYTIPGGQYCAYIPGSGTWIGWVSGAFASGGNICNWDVTAEFFDANWRWKRTYVSGRNYGCTRGAGASINLPYYMSQLTGSNYGWMCSTLRVGGQRVTSVCHYIHP